MTNGMLSSNSSPTASDAGHPVLTASSSSLPAAFSIPRSVALSAYTTAIVCSAAGNGYVIVSFLLSKQAKMVTNVLILSLSWANLLTGCLLPAFAMMQLVNPAHSAWRCNLPVYVELALVVCTTLSHVAVGVDRYLAVMHPNGPHLSVKAVRYAVLGIWGAGVLYCLRLTAQFKGERNLDEWWASSLFCNLFVFEAELGLVYRAVDFAFLFVLPMSALSVMYFRVGRRLWDRRQRVTRVVDRRRKVVLYLGVSLLLFFVSWCPFYVLDMVVDNPARRKKPYVIMRFVFVMMAVGNCFVTPCLYIVFFPALRENTQVQLLGAMVTIVLRSKRRRRRIQGDMPLAVPGAGSDRVFEDFTSTPTLPSISALVQAAEGAHGPGVGPGQALGRRDSAVSTQV